MMSDEEFIERIREKFEAKKEQYPERYANFVALLNKYGVDDPTELMIPYRNL